MIRMLDMAEPNDFIVATGEPRTVREFTEVAFGYAGLDWQQHVEVVPSLVSRQPRKLVGNPQRLERGHGLEPVGRLFANDPNPTCSRERKA